MPSRKEGYGPHVADSGDCRRQRFSAHRFAVPCCWQRGEAFRCTHRRRCGAAPTSLTGEAACLFGGLLLLVSAGCYHPFYSPYGYGPYGFGVSGPQPGALPYQSPGTIAPTPGVLPSQPMYVPPGDVVFPPSERPTYQPIPSDTPDSQDGWESSDDDTFDDDNKFYGDPDYPTFNEDPVPNPREGPFDDSSGMFESSDTGEAFGDQDLPTTRRGANFVEPMTTTPTTTPVTMVQYGFDPEYRWVSGILQYDSTQQQWNIHYRLKPDPTDRYSGRLALANNARLRRYRNGDIVKIYGRPAHRQHDAEGKPLYIARRIEHYNVEMKR